MWCTIELNLGIGLGCVTAMRPFVRRYFPRLLGLSSGSYDDTSRKYGQPLGSIPRSDNPGFTGNKSHQYSTNLTTLTTGGNESEEHILSTLEGQGKNPRGLDGIVRTVEFDVENSTTQR